MKYLKFSYSDAYSLPVYKREWFIGRIKKHHDDERESHQKQLKKQKRSF